MLLEDRFQERLRRVFGIFRIGNGIVDCLVCLSQSIVGLHAETVGLFVRGIIFFTFVGYFYSFPVLPLCNPVAHKPYHGQLVGLVVFQHFLVVPVCRCEIPCIKIELCALLQNIADRSLGILYRQLVCRIEISQRFVVFLQCIIENGTPPIFGVHMDFIGLPVGFQNLVSGS